MGRQQFNDGQEVVFADYKKIQSRSEKELYDDVIFEMIQRKEGAMFDDSFKVSFVSATSVTVNKGAGFQTDATVDAAEPQKRLLFRAANVNLNTATPDGSLDRIDIITIKNARVDGVTESRKFKNASTSVITTENLVVSNEWESVFNVIAGTPDASPVAPAVPAGEIKIGTLLITAVSGMSGSGAITDNRLLMPIGEEILINSVGYVKLTAGSDTPLKTLLSEIDAFLLNGDMDDNVFKDSVSDPAAPPTAGDLKLYNKGELLFVRNQAGVVTPVGSGGGGGGSAVWNDDTDAPIADTEFNELVYLYESELDQKLFLYLKVPQGYIAGRQIQMFIGQYSPSSSNTQLLTSVATLIRKNNDAIDSTTNQKTSTNTAITNTVANQSREVILDLTTALGLINSVAVSPGDIIKVELTRGTDTDTADIRFIPSATEVKFG